MGALFRFPTQAQKPDTPVPLGGTVFRTDGLRSSTLRIGSVIAEVVADTSRGCDPRVRRFESGQSPARLGVPLQPPAYASDGSSSCTGARGDEWDESDGTTALSCHAPVLGLSLSELYSLQLSHLHPPHRSYKSVPLESNQDRRPYQRHQATRPSRRF